MSDQPICPYCRSAEDVGAAPNGRWRCNACAVSFTPSPTPSEANASRSTDERQAIEAADAAWRREATRVATDPSGRPLTESEASQMQHERISWKDGYATACIEHQRELEELRKRAELAEAKVIEAQAVYDGPLVEDWAEAVRKEAAHQVVRWGVEHDDGKDSEAWYWLLGRLAGKAVDALHRGDLEKALHHTISSGAVLLNWHARLKKAGNLFRPGIAEPPEE